MAHSEETKRKIGEANKISHKGKRLSPQHRESISLALRGKKISAEGRMNMSMAKMGNKYANGHKHTEESRRKMSEAKKGERSYLWKGGISSINERIRKGIEYKLWRKSVFERDKYTCVFCLKIGGQLHADHIKPFALFPELRFAIDNGRTLCVDCHRATDSYGSKMNKNYRNK